MAPLFIKNKLVECEWMYEQIVKSQCKCPVSKLYFSGSEQDRLTPRLFCNDHFEIVKWAGDKPVYLTIKSIEAWA